MHAATLYLDSTDAAILRSLQEDARASLRTISKKVGVSVPTVSARLRNLEQIGIVRGYRVLLNPDVLESPKAAFVVRTRPRAAEAVARQIAEREWAHRVLIGRPGWILVDVSMDRSADVDASLEDVSNVPDVTDVQEYEVLRTVKDEPATIPEERLAANVPCFECKGPIRGDPVRARLDGRYHYFCCHSCERLYLEKYGRIKAAARGRRKPRAAAEAPRPR